MEATPEKQATDQEARFFFAILKHMKSKPDTDWDAVAKELNYSNGNTAQVRFRQIKKKLGLTLDKATTPSTNKVVKNRTPKSSGAKAKASNKASAKTTVDDKGADMEHPVDQGGTVKPEVKDEKDLDLQYAEIMKLEMANPAWI